MVRWTVILISLGLCLALASCFPQFHSWRQKLTLVVATPSGDVSGSAVVQVKARFWPEGLPLSMTEVEYDVTGEATVVEVAPGRYLFALVTGSQQRFYAAARARFTRPSLREGAPPEELTRGEWLYDIPRQTEPVSLLPDHVPMLVTFDDITRPETVRQVDPRDLDAAFGCAREPAGLVLPWRAAGLIYDDWREDQVWKLASAGASAQLGITGETAAALEAADLLRRPGEDWDPPRPHWQLQDALEQLLTEEQSEAWLAAHEALRTDPPTTLPSPEAAAEAWGGPCHRLTEVQLAITTEGVTQIIVEEFLPWLGPYPETPLLQKIEPTNFSFEAKMRQGGFLQGN